MTAASAMRALKEAERLFAAGELDASHDLLAQVHHADPAYPYALYLRAMMMAAAGHRQQGCALLEEACRLRPKSRDMQALRARIYADLGRAEDALDILSKLAEAGNMNAAMALDRGTLARRLGKFKLAMESYDAALSLDPGLTHAWSGKANLLHEHGYYAEALRCHDEALAREPDSVEVICNRTATLNRLGRLEEAFAESNRALELAPNDAGAWTTRGCTLVQMEDAKQAMRCFEQALHIDSGHRPAHANRASTLAALGKHQEALKLLEEAMKLAQAYPSELATLRAKEGMLRLMLGDWRGWEGYEHRLVHDTLPAVHDLLAPRWTGKEALAGKTILIWSEQGYGDTIQFCRYAACLAERGATVLLEVPAPLLNLCRQLPVASIRVRGETLPPHDFQISMMSMPLALGPRTAIPLPHAYLRAPDEKVQRWTARLAPRGRRPRVGIVCSGSPHNNGNATRSMPLAAFAPLTEHAELIVLQPELTLEDSSTLQNMSGIMKAEVDINDFTDVAGLIANTDLVLSVDTAIAHLTGALGHPLWVLLPWQAEWRWMTGRHDTPWYNSARLYRQSSRGCWDSVIAAVAQAMAEEFC
ncbi:tetratricopeptide repeat protein [Noviherbaspirillum soli]|uniref:tetratricopeptide repeat protein n=1 Tax=Noviherbaspirillum soli TaxID=1064518 RepID=UPI00188A8DB5|nr:tetratricopeptide repeat protein [Noviherbaspirillum soli]